MAAENGEAGYWSTQLAGYLCQDEGRLVRHAIEHAVRVMKAPTKNVRRVVVFVMMRGTEIAVGF